MYVVWSQTFWFGGKNDWGQKCYLQKNLDTTNLKRVIWFIDNDKKRKNNAYIGKIMLWNNAMYMDECYSKCFCMSVVFIVDIYM